MRDALADALDALENKVGDLADYVRKKLGYDSDEELDEAPMRLQIDSVAAAIYQMETRGRGVVIADQTGIGKGRQAAAIIRWAVRSVRVPIVVTASRPCEMRRRSQLPPSPTDCLSAG